MKRLKLNLDQLGKELEMLDNEHLRGIKGGWDGGYGAYGGYNSWEELWEAMQNGYVPPEGDYNPGGYGGYWGDFGGYGGYNNPIPIPEVIVYGGYGGGYNGYDDYWEDYYGGYYGNYGGYYTGGYGGYYNGGYGGYYNGGYGGYYAGGGGSNSGGGQSNGGDSSSNGDPIQQILDKVKFDADITNQFKDNFKAALASIKGTEIGETLLNKLAAKTGEITVTNNGEHSVQGNTLNVGMFDSDPEAFIGKYQALSLGHELFHLMQNAEYGTTKAEISYEVEARLFEYELAKGLEDLDNFFRNFANDSYKDDFVDFAEGNNNTIGDFNSLIDGFKNGMNGGSVYDGYDQTHINSWDDIIWDNINKN